MRSLGQIARRKRALPLTPDSLPLPARSTEDSAGADSVMPEGYGSDGTSANQPRFNTVSYNLCRELGIHEKQSSFYTQFKSAQNHIHSNIVYNGPRAHLNNNDGFAGGQVCARHAHPRTRAPAHPRSLSNAARPRLLTLLPSPSPSASASSSRTTSSSTLAVNPGELPAQRAPGPLALRDRTRRVRTTALAHA